MPRRRISKNVHTKPELAGSKNMTEEYIKKAQNDEEGASLMSGLSDLFSTSLKRPRKSAWDYESLSRELLAFFKFCDEKNLKPAKSGIRLWLAVSKQQYADWESFSSRYGDISDLINQANEILEMQYISRAEKYPTANVFLLKTSHGHRESSEVRITTSTTDEELADRIKNLNLK